ncbi:hypothetical protein GF323_01840 [Candidatus Woesearchaeota archaeon]|nr:hypothetical protein [Candidatus Woesearchaeota archaeon]
MKPKKNNDEKKKDGEKNKKKKPGKKEKAKKPRKRLQKLLEKSGLNISKDKLTKVIFDSVVIINILISAYIILIFSFNEEFTLSYLLVVMLFVWIIGFIALMLLAWLVFYVFIDFRVYQRKVGIEDVFPDFLQLTSANIRAGMPIDQALWHAIRPNFGVLAKEMEDVAKQTMSGSDLEDALRGFAEKYDSPLLKRSISLLIEGLAAGGEIGELLDRISTNIQQSKIMEKEMSASVTTYAIFISFAAVLAAPFLLALSSQLLIIIKGIVSTIEIPETGASQMPIGITDVSVAHSDFMIFAYFTLTITSFLSACIVATIKKGNIRAGFRYLPLFVFSTLVLFFILNKLLGYAMSGIF